jgi:hypothetical protein
MRGKFRRGRGNTPYTPNEERVYAYNKNDGGGDDEVFFLPQLSNQGMAIPIPPHYDSLMGILQDIRRPDCPLFIFFGYAARGMGVEGGWGAKN